MKTRILTIVAAAALLSAVPAFAQNTGPDQEKGSTGWSGGSKDQPGQQGAPKDPTTGQAVQVHDEAKAKDQPEMATGEDLKGKPERFAPSKTPE